MILISILIAVAIIIGLLGLSVYMLRPETEKTRSFAAFDNTMIAHRGLFNNNSPRKTVLQRSETHWSMALAWSWMCS